MFVPAMGPYICHLMPYAAHCRLLSCSRCCGSRPLAPRTASEPTHVTCLRRGCAARACSRTALGSPACGWPPCHRSLPTTAAQQKTTQRALTVALIWSDGRHVVGIHPGGTSGLAASTELLQSTSARAKGSGAAPCCARGVAPLICCSAPHLPPCLQEHGCRHRFPG